MVSALKTQLVGTLRSVDCVATTTDCWSARNRSYLGVTAHWIDNVTLSRVSAALACRRLRGSHTFLALASALESVHRDYGISRSVVMTSTDNGSNFVKAFSVFGRVQQDGGGDEEESDDESGVNRAVSMERWTQSTMRSTMNSTLATLLSSICRGIIAAHVTHFNWWQHWTQTLLKTTLSTSVSPGQLSTSVRRSGTSPPAPSCRRKQSWRLVG